MPLKLWKALLGFLILVALFSVLQRSLPETLWVVSFIATLTYEISLLFSEEIPPYRRFALGYLVFAGTTYLLAGILGFFPTWGLVEGAMWYRLINPGPLLILLDQCVRHFPCTTSGIQFDVFPVSEPHIFFSFAAIIVSLIAITAAFLMAKENKSAYWIWLALVVFSFAETFAYLLADSANWGSIYGAVIHSRESIVALVWATSYLAAYLLVNIRRRPEIPDQP